jgi:hypothetical protein
MGRNHTFMDREFGRSRFDPDDEGDYERDLVFVGMPFKDEMDEVYATIREVCASLSLRAARVDDSYAGSGFIIREITELIEQAEFLIFDLSFERPNVYYELGYSHGVGNEAAEILLIAREGTNVHFDSTPLRVRFYKTTEHLRGIIETSLREMMRRTRR